MIQMTNVTKKYRNGVTALNDINLTIERGEFVYIIGQSGAGKSSLIRLVNREEKADKGTIDVSDFKNISHLKQHHLPDLRRYVGVVFQDFKLLPKLTVYENVAYAMEVVSHPQQAIEKYVMDVLEMVNLEDKKDRFPNQLSGGEMQRVAIARAIVNSPGILIADEPTGNLDPETAIEIMEILEKINQMGTTIIMATHNAELVNQYPHRIIELNHGDIVRDETGGGYYRDL